MLRIRNRIESLDLAQIHPEVTFLSRCAHSLDTSNLSPTRHAFAQYDGNSPPLSPSYTTLQSHHDLATEPALPFGDIHFGAQDACRQFLPISSDILSVR
jgi:hypothetical protein